MQTEYLVFIKECVSILATIMAMIIAIWGVNSWKRQLKGSIEYDLARRLLKSTFQLREAIQAVRDPFIWEYEQSMPDESEVRKMTRDGVRFYGLAKAYQTRWKKVSDLRIDLQTGLLEAEVLWGKEIYEPYKKLFELQKELHLDVVEYLEVCNPDQSQDAREAYVKMRKGHREVIYNMARMDKPDDFTEDIMSAIIKIEDFLKPHLRK